MLNSVTPLSHWFGQNAGRTLSATDAPERSAANQLVVFVVGGLVDGPRPAEARDFPLLAREPNESERNHIVRVARLIESARLLGGTYLVVPRAHVGWLADHPRLIKYFGANFELVDANPESGLTFRL
jgi:hypothetical protein